MQKLELDLQDLLLHRDMMEKSMRYFTSPMSGGMVRGSGLAVDGLRDELVRTERRIGNIKKLLNKVS
jgi:hypothetical protein